MTKAELVQEVIDLGYDYVDSARIGKFVDRAYRMLCSRRNWPFLEAEVTGTAPLELSELGKVLSVKNTTAEEQPRGVSRRWLVANYPNLTETGRPIFWYLENKTLKLYPVDSEAQLEVRVKKRPTALADSDEPLVPDEWQYIIVDMAVIPCLKDDDEREEARALRADVEQSILEMSSDLLGRNFQNPPTTGRTGTFGDYLG